MKKVCVVMSLFVCFLSVVSCKKNDVSFAKAKLVGSWELRAVFGGQVPGLSPYFSPGNGSIIKFSDTGYQRYFDNVLTKSGTYQITRISSGDPGIPDDALIFDSDTYSPVTHFSVIRDTLTLYMGTIATDGYIAKYVHK